MRRNDEGYRKISVVKYTKIALLLIIIFSVFASVFLVQGIVFRKGAAKFTDTQVLLTRAPTLVISPTPVGDPAIIVISPNGGEEWALGTTQIIRWGGLIPVPVDIYLWKGNQSLLTIIKDYYGQPDPPTIYVWTLPVTIAPGSDYKIEVVNSTYQVGDMSDDYFSIVGTSISPTFSPCNIPGDANHDCKVDGFDYVIWWINFGSTKSGSENGDFDGNGQVDGFDYVIWWLNFGTISPTPTPFAKLGECYHPCRSLEPKCNYPLRCFYCDPNLEPPCPIPNPVCLHPTCYPQPQISP